MTSEELKRLKEICEAATSGNWTSEDCDWFEAEARSALPKLIQEVEQLRASRDEWKSQYLLKLEKNKVLEQERDQLEAENKNLRYLKEQYFQSDLAVREQRNQLRERVAKLRKALKRVSKASEYGWEARICADALATDDEMGD